MLSVDETMAEGKSLEAKFLEAQAAYNKAKVALRNAKGPYSEWVVKWSELKKAYDGALKEAGE